MALPEGYTSIKQYFNDTLPFLKEFQWMYNYPNTHILHNKIFEKFPSDWTKYLSEINIAELKYIGLGVVNESAPESLKEFVGVINKLKPPFKIFGKDKRETTPLPKNSRISKKKEHEIYSLAPLIDEVCKTKNIGLIVDVGTGLGYLAQYLHSEFNYKILGIEGNEEKYGLAMKAQEKNYRFSQDSVQYVCHFITETSAKIIRECIDNAFTSQKEENLCITGLHACADLSITILKIFLELKSAKTLMIMPCCYHKLEKEPSSAGKESFRNFPASRTLKEIFERLDGASFFNVPFLRLACQQSNSSWKTMTNSELELHSQNCMFRGILQVVAERENIVLSRSKRKTGKSKPDPKEDYTIEKYIEQLPTSYTFKYRDDEAKPVPMDYIKMKMLKEWEMNGKYIRLILIIIAFQTALQAVCENVVLLDRVQFLKEKGVDCKVYKVTEDRISPRCFALVATKNNEAV